jgi:hypothetical protein
MIFLLTGQCFPPLICIINILTVKLSNSPLLYAISYVILHREYPRKAMKKHGLAKKVVP